MRYFLLFLFTALLGVGCQSKLGASDPIASLKQEQDDNFKLKGEYKHKEPFVASDGKTYTVDTETQWFSDGKSIKNYRIREVQIPVTKTTSTL